MIAAILSFLSSLLSHSDPRRLPPGLFDWSVIRSGGTVTFEFTPPDESRPYLAVGHPLQFEGTTFGDVPLLMTAHLEVWDSPNSAGVVIDAVRCAKLALDRGIGGALLGPSSYFMKSPPEQYTDDVCKRKVEEFIAANGHPAAVAQGLGAVAI